MDEAERCLDCELREGLSPNAPITEEFVNWIETESAVEDHQSIDNECSLCTAAAVSFLLLSHQTAEKAEKPLEWLGTKERRWYVHHHRGATSRPDYAQGMHYTAGVLEAFVDAYGPKDGKTLTVLHKFLERRRNCSSLLKSWTKYSDVTAAELFTALFPALLRFRCAGGEFSSETKKKMRPPLKQVVAQMKKEGKARNLPSPGFYYPVRDSLAALVLADDLNGPIDLLKQVLKYFRKYASSEFFEKKSRRRLIDSSPSRTACYLSAWLSYQELELARGDSLKRLTSLARE